MYFQSQSHHCHSNNISDMEMKLDSKFLVTKSLTSPFQSAACFPYTVQAKAALRTCRALPHIVAKAPTGS